MLTLWRCLRLFLTMTLITGVVYPLLVTAVAKLLMPKQAEGSLIFQDDRLIGSSLIAQKFEQEKYFWPRPSAVDYDPLPSGASNLGPISKELKQMVLEREKKLLEKAPSQVIPRELLYASGSGLDPHISPETVYFQLQRVLEARGWEKNELKVANVIRELTENTFFPYLGPTYINVLKLNLALDQLEAKR